MASAWHFVSGQQDRPGGRVPVEFPGLLDDRGSTKGHWSMGSRSIIPVHVKRRARQLVSLRDYYNIVSFDATHLILIEGP